MALVFSVSRTKNIPLAASVGKVIHLFFLSLAGWEEERVSSPSILRLIFQGRFLHGNVTLGGKTIADQRRHQREAEWHLYAFILLKTLLLTY